MAELNYLILNKVSDSAYQIFTKDSHKKIACYVRDVDGYFYCELMGTGLYSDYTLIELGNKLKELNKDWDDEIKRVFSKT